MERNEEWRDVVGYEGDYMISSWGRVKSLYFKKERILRGQKVGSGYLRVDLWKDGKHECCYIHRLVAKAFLDNPNNYVEVNHIDEDKTNNRAENLEWITHLENVRYGTGNERRSKAHSKRIYQLSRDSSEILNVYHSATEAAQCVNGYFGNISHCARGDYGCPTAHGYKWIYAEDLLKPFRQENKEENTTQ